MNIYRQVILSALLMTAYAQERVTLTMIDGEKIDKIEVSKIEGDYLIYDGIRKIGHERYGKGDKFVDVGTKCEIKCEKIDGEKYTVSVDITDNKFIEWKEKDGSVIPIINKRHLATKLFINTGETQAVFNS